MQTWQVGSFVKFCTCDSSIDLGSWIHCTLFIVSCHSMIHEITGSLSIIGYCTASHYLASHHVSQITRIVPYNIYRIRVACLIAQDFAVSSDWTALLRVSSHSGVCPRRIRAAHPGAPRGAQQQRLHHHLRREAGRLGSRLARSPLPRLRVSRLPPRTVF